MIFPAIFCGGFTAERTILLGSIPIDAESGEMLRTLWLLADPLRGDPNNHWVLTIGRFAAGAFKAERSLPFAGGFPLGVVRVSLDPEIRVSRGDVLALRVTPTGAGASPLTGLSVIPEYAHSGARAR